MEAETLAADVLRTFKCLKIFLLFSERKYYWKKLHDLGKVLVKTLLRVVPTFFVWFSIILGFTIMGHHIEGGRILVNEEGEIDMEGGSPNRFNFNDIYHSLVFMLLDSVDEDWDSLMFQEYLGVNPVIVGFQMVAMFICFLLCFKYLTGSYTNELDLVLDEVESEDKQNQDSKDKR